MQSSISVVKDAMSKHDIVITTGGVSIGDFDYLPEIYKVRNAEVLFNKVAMRPGSVTTVALQMGNIYLVYQVIHRLVSLDLNYLSNLRFNI